MKTNSKAGNRETSKPKSQPTTEPKDKEPSASAGKSATGPEPERSGAGFVSRNVGDEGKPDAKPSRVGFNVTEKGTIDWKPMKDGNRKQLVDILSADPELKKIMAGIAAEEKDFKITEYDIQETLRGLNGVNAMMTRFALARFKKFDIDPDILELAYDMEHCPNRKNPQHQKDCESCKQMQERFKELTKRGSRLANKYCGEWIKKHLDEIFFLQLYFRTVASQAQIAIMGQSARNDQKNKQAAAEANAKPNGAPRAGTRIQEVQPTI